ncbi:hypothetical protein EMIT0P100_250019 [Pseudomonas sp. IT-P100]
MAGRKRATHWAANATHALKQIGWSGRCKDCTSRNAPTFQRTGHEEQKFRLFLHFVTDRFCLAKMSLGQNLER